MIWLPEICTICLDERWFLPARQHCRIWTHSYIDKKTRYKWKWLITLQNTRSAKLLTIWMRVSMSVTLGKVHYRFFERKRIESPFPLACINSISVEEFQSHSIHLQTNHLLHCKCMRVWVSECHRCNLSESNVQSIATESAKNGKKVLVNKYSIPSNMPDKLSLHLETRIPVRKKKSEITLCHVIKFTMPSFIIGMQKICLLPFGRSVAGRPFFFFSHNESLSEVRIYRHPSR